MLIECVTEVVALAVRISSPISGRVAIKAVTLAVVDAELSALAGGLVG